MRGGQAVSGLLPTHERDSDRSWHDGVSPVAARGTRHSIKKVSSRELVILSGIGVRSEPAAVDQRRLGPRPMHENHPVVVAGEGTGVSERGRATGVHLENRLGLATGRDAPNRVPSGNTCHHDVALDGVRCSSRRVQSGLWRVGSKGSDATVAYLAGACGTMQ